ncbi:precorrin-3B synthase [Bosea sp. 117]|uniref:precorrin-3B synthase n=1 Tax=Bosea sp. 117 TaxID=1125973 RepID=UPI0004945CE7|nr:precorrin-3B synthase [Bosea sp. 117]
MSAALSHSLPVRPRGACPTLPEPMPTGDGLLARIALAAPAKPAQFAALAGLAARHGNGIVEVTARGKLQVRGLTEASAAPFARDVGALDLALREGLEIQINPLAGLAPMHFDPRPIADAIAEAVATAGLGPRLAPKLAVVVDGGGAPDLSALSADIRLAPAPDAAKREVLVSAAMAPLGLVPLERAVEAVLLLLGLLAARGRRARMAALVEQEGTAPLLAALDRVMTALPQPAASAEGRPEAVGLHVLEDGRVALGIGLPFGHGEARSLVALAQEAEKSGGSAIMPAAGRTLLLIGVAENAAPVLRSMSAALGFIVDADDPLRHVDACPGMPSCASAHIETRALAATLALLAGGRRVHVSGCAKGCAHPAGADLTIVGLDGGAGLVVEGGPRDAPAEIVPVDRLAAAARSLLEKQGV